MFAVRNHTSTAGVNKDPVHDGQPKTPLGEQGPPQCRCKIPSNCCDQHSLARLVLPPQHHHSVEKNDHHRGPGPSFLDKVLVEDVVFVIVVVVNLRLIRV